MKAILLSILSFAVALTVQAQNGFVITGNIKGNADGMKVYLRDNNWQNPNTVDSAIIKNGQFVLRGSVAVPALYSLIIDKTPKSAPSSEKNWLMSRFYIENSNISFSGNIDSLPTYFYNSRRAVKPAIITGSKTEDESIAYKKSIEGLRKAYAVLDEQYLQLYHMPALEGKFNTKVGMALIKAQKIISKEMENFKWNYIAQHPSSVIAYDEAYNTLNGMFISLTVPQIDSLVGWIEKGWKGTPQMQALKADAEKAKKTALGTHYQDFELQTPDGKKVMLSQYVPKGKYVMLEFWASWCGPCRGEIPHLREVNKHKADNFEIVSISLDEDDAAWKKAMKEEAMVWTQLVDPHGFESKIAQAYNILGIPFSLLLDKEGRIIAANVRGAALDVALENL